MSECVQCGHCCKTGTCGYADWDAERKCCSALTEDTRCSLYDDIVLAEKHARYPMFGCGCSSTLFNTVREDKIKEMQS